METLGDVIMLALIVAALAVVPYKLAKVWLVPPVKRLFGLFVMSTPAEQSPRATDTSAVHVPVPRTDTGASTAEDGRDITDEWQPPRIGRRLSDGEIVTLLATQKGEDGARYRFSANQIYELVKGPRAEVLAQIRAIREGAPAPQVREHQARLEELATNGHE